MERVVAILMDRTEDFSVMRYVPSRKLVLRLTPPKEKAILPSDYRVISDEAHPDFKLAVRLDIHLGGERGKSYSGVMNDRGVAATYAFYMDEEKLGDAIQAIPQFQTAEKTLDKFFAPNQ